MSCNIYDADVSNLPPPLGALIVNVPRRPPLVSVLSATRPLLPSSLSPSGWSSQHWQRWGASISAAAVVEADQMLLSAGVCARETAVVTPQLALDRHQLHC
jgi:hypothetical protein